MTYATRECHDCGRLSGRDTMQRHTSRRKTGQTVSINADTGMRRVSSERYSNRHILVCAECGNRRTLISNIQTGVVLVIIVIVVALMVTNSRRTNDEAQFAPVAEVADQRVFVESQPNSVEAAPPVQELVESAPPSSELTQPVPLQLEPDETVVVATSETPTQPTPEDLTGLY